VVVDFRIDQQADRESSVLQDVQHPPGTHPMHRSS